MSGGPVSHASRLVSGVALDAATIYTLIAGSPAFVHDSDESLLPVYARIVTEAVPEHPGRG